MESAVRYTCQCKVEMSPLLQSRDVPFAKGGYAGMVESWHSCGGYGSAGEQPERRHEAEDWAERSPLCSLISAQFLAKSEKLKSQTGSVWVMGNSLLDGFAIEMMAIASPGVMRIGGLGGLDLVVEGFSIDDFCLADWAVVDGIG
jgi:hypothetical protein